MGETVVDSLLRPLLEVEGRAEGAASADGRLWGTYLHGLFESGAGRRRVLDWARGGAEASPGAARDHRALREAACNRLADVLAACIDPRVLRELGGA